MRHAIEFTAEAQEQYDALPATWRSKLARAIADRLTHEPLVENRNRFPMVAPWLGEWELRVAGKGRVWYRVDNGTVVVTIVEVGLKDRETTEEVRK